MPNDFLSDPTLYERYQRIVDRARSAGEIGSTYPQTPLQRVAAGLVSFLPTIEDVRQAYQFLKVPLSDRLTATSLYNTARKLPAVASKMLDLQDVGTQNALIGLGAGALSRFNQPADIAEEFAGRSPRHTTKPVYQGLRPRYSHGVGEGEFNRGAFGIPANDDDLLDRWAELAQSKWDSPAIVQHRTLLEKEIRRRGLADLAGLDAPQPQATLDMGGGLMEPDQPLKLPADIVDAINNNPQVPGLRKTLQKYSNDELFNLFINLEKLLSQSEPGSYNHMRDRIAMHLVKEEMTNRAKPSRFKSRAEATPIDPELMKARERVRARERTRIRKTDELMSPPEEGNKLGPLPPIKTAIYAESPGDDAVTFARQLDRVKKLTDRVKYEQDYHTIHEGPAGILTDPFTYSSDKHTAAIKYNGKVYWGKYHADILDAHPELKSMPPGIETGFVNTRTGEFMPETPHSKGFVEWDDAKNKFIWKAANPPMKELWYEPASYLPERVKSMSDMDLMSNMLKAGKMLPPTDPERIAITNELRRRGIIPPGTKF